MRSSKLSLLAGVSALALVTGRATHAASLSFVFTGAVETGTITQSGNYRISLGGGRGGGSTDYEYSGSIGALLSGGTYLSAGSTFAVLVGGDGQTGAFSGGGGGMSFLDIGNDGTFEAVAGGGGGAGLYETGGPGLAGPDGGSLYYQGAGSPYGSGAGGVAGTGGLAGGGDSGSGGAGIRQHGQDSRFAGSSSTGGAAGPTWAGGAAGSDSGSGGFGGGGGGNYYGGGGGGGYSGGGGGDGYTLFFEPGGSGGGGGGGSYLSSIFTDRKLTTGGATSGAFVRLDHVPPAPVPTPGAVGLMATSMLAIGAMARRRRKAD